jgi:hypothetical protein
MKKSAWTDLDQKYFEKIVKVSDVEIEKSAWTDLDQRHFEKKIFNVQVVLTCCRLRRPGSRVNKMGLLSKLLEPGDRQSVLHFDGLPLTRGAVVATPFADAFSLTFRPVKSTDALAS